ncbi:hypothetical protein [Bacillus sp. MRMR6]|uniref:hypothetical protein n=1 Tax=Bacillus sp. MRMR6 TaxID=1928617 RepID=UPI000950F663|nr:hypothetical protein [Bacillus sp. MRMR6]OLS40495.1 hypothetical protein BTR25_08275 [Bacillus sp. MRMR6]
MEGFDYKHFDGLGLAELIKKKEVQPKEVLKDAIRTIEQHNCKLNAVIHKLYDKAETLSQTREAISSKQKERLIKS